MPHSRVVRLLVGAASGLVVAACGSQPKPVEPNRPSRGEVETAMRNVYSDMVGDIARARSRLGIDRDEVVVVPIDKLSMEIQGYLNPSYRATLRDMFIDLITDQERSAARGDLAVVPYDTQTFYRLMQTEGIGTIEDLVRPENQRKIAAALERNNNIVDGFARLKLQEGLGRNYVIRLEFVPLNGQPPIRTRGESIPNVM